LIALKARSSTLAHFRSLQTLGTYEKASQNIPLVKVMSSI